MPRGSAYEAEVRHGGLGAYRHIRGADPDVVMQKAQAQQRVWEERWRKLQRKEQTSYKKLAKKELAQGRTAAASSALAFIDNTLRYALRRSPVLDWEALKDRSPFPKPEPRAPESESLPSEPSLMESRFQPTLSLLDRLLSSRSAQRLADAITAFDKDHANWDRSCKEITDRNRMLHQKYESELERWNKDRDIFLQRQAANNAGIDERRKAYLEGAPADVIDYCDVVLANSVYPDAFPKSFEIEYIVETKTLVVDYQLPGLEALPTLKEVKNIASKNELVESHLKSRMFAKSMTSCFMRLPFVHYMSSLRQM